ncbi:MULTISPECIES: glycoside hydrolase family 28 protein [Niastella]|uniref:Glycoside hydrolase family 28 protein n=1 Tax=Niastella soli TaxID=2821487 RepID=A0ABS3YYJ4_9BACT|nr:glycoside hydrolase family 28 protein [Niastella soli]MBO9202899.1 glycoside hydrolase family 28 protein [Niastella soli]
MKKNKIVAVVMLAIGCLPAALLHAQTSKEKEPFSWSNLPAVTQPVFKPDTFNIVQFGSVADGLALNTTPINKAIATCSEKGGGVVLIPGGIWLTGPVEMKSNVNLHLDRDAILLFSKDFDQYQLVEGTYEGRRSARNQSPIQGTNLENIAITGRGVIDGNGDVWRMVGRDRLTESQWKAKVASGGLVSSDNRIWFPSVKTKLAFDQKRGTAWLPGQTLKDFEDIKDFLRPNLVVFNNCKKVLLEGVTFQNSPAWCLHPVLCEDLTVRNLFVKNPDYAQNGDGLDVESCKNVLIEGSTFDVGDDGICIKSGKDEEGRKRGKPTENVIIRNNVVYKAHGGFVIGSEMSGGARNIFVYDCSFMGTDIGLRFKTVRGRGGVVENIYVKNIRMKDIVQDAILFDMYYFAKPPAAGEKVEVPPVTEATPRFRNFQITDIVCNGANRGIFIRGLPEMKVKDIDLNNIVLKTNKGAEIIEANDIRMKDLTLLSSNSNPVVYVESGSNITMTGFKYSPDAGVVFSINGNKNENIRVSNANLNNRNKVAFSNGASRSAFITE